MAMNRASHDRQQSGPSTNIYDSVDLVPTPPQSMWSVPYFIVAVIIFVALLLLSVIFVIAVLIYTKDANGDGYYQSSLANTIALKIISYPFIQNNFAYTMKYSNLSQIIALTLNTINDHILHLNTSSISVQNDIAIVLKDLLQLLLNDSTDDCPTDDIPTSCKELKGKHPNSPSGIYLLETINNGTKHTYCNMGELCGSRGGWTRIAHLNMTDPAQNCPSGFRMYQSGVFRACGRPESFIGSCISVQFPSNGISYSQVCGRVIGYQVGTTDPVGIGHQRRNCGLNSYYVDGISITRSSPRIHVWTAMAGWSGKSMTDSLYCCPCSTGCTHTSCTGIYWK